ncbi:YicS family protein [Serratia marcescens]|uniref:YicS family protein n=1 Tax=Serratia marcescens TaxID=615 RepID=UPI00165330CA|nr:YicS family protein [Serratia marcescens]
MLACLAVPAAFASTPLQGLQFEQQKKQVMKDITKTCTPSKHLSESDFANKILANEDNKRRVRDATVALERNNQKNYWDAIGQIQCPDM